MGLHPLHFEQVRLVDNDPHCDQIMFRWEWQTSDHVSREEIARAIADAEAQIEEYLGYRLAPSWEVDEWRGTDRHFRKEFINFNSADVRGFRQTVQSNYGYFISGGVQSKLLIGGGGDTITWTDEDGDGYFETGTITVATTVTDPCEVAIYYPGKLGDDSWEIRPIQVSIAAGTATIVFKRELAVIPELFDLYDIESAEAIGTDDNQFLDEVDTYRRFNDPQTQAIFLWEPMAGTMCNCNGDGCAVCAYASQNGCLTVRGNPRQSIIGYGPAVWNSDTEEFDPTVWAVGRQPDIVRLYYYSGWRNKSLSCWNQMDPEWERVVARMAAAKLDRPPCDCAKGDWSRWREDLTLISGDEDGKPYYREPKGILNNPFGSRRGEVEAWRKVAKEMRAQGVLV